MLLGHSTCSRVSAPPPRVAVVTGFFPDIDAPHGVRFVAQSVPDRALADHSAVGVNAATVLADPFGLHAFIYVCHNNSPSCHIRNSPNALTQLVILTNALLLGMIQLVAGWAIAYVGSHQVLTLSWRWTQSGHLNLMKRTCTLSETHVYST